MGQGPTSAQQQSPASDLLTSDRGPDVWHPVALELDLEPVRWDRAVWEDGDVEGSPIVFLFEFNRAEATYGRVAEGWVGEWGSE